MCEYERDKETQRKKSGTVEKEQKSVTRRW